MSIYLATWLLLQIDVLSFLLSILKTSSAIEWLGVFLLLNTLSLIAQIYFSWKGHYSFWVLQSYLLFSCFQEPHVTHCCLRLSKFRLRQKAHRFCVQEILFSLISMLCLYRSCEKTLATDILPLRLLCRKHKFGSTKVSTCCMVSGILKLIEHSVKL